MGELTFLCSSQQGIVLFFVDILFFINTDYPVLPAKLPFYPHIIRVKWDFEPGNMGCIVVAFANVTWSYIFIIVILSN